MKLTLILISIAIMLLVCGCHSTDAQGSKLEEPTQSGPAPTLSPDQAAAFKQSLQKKNKGGE